MLTNLPTMSTFSFIENGPTYTREEIYTMANDGQIMFVREMEWLKDLENPFDAADRIATAMKEVYGLIIFDSELYYCQHEVKTIMDVLEQPYEFGIDEVVAWLLLRAFKKAGFKYATECDMSELRKVYAQMGYPPYGLSTHYKRLTYPGREHDTYEYEQIKKDNTLINIELVYHPRFIKQWLDQGNEIEDYP